MTAPPLCPDCERPMTHERISSTGESWHRCPKCQTRIGLDSPAAADADVMEFIYSTAPDLSAHRLGQLHPYAGTWAVAMFISADSPIRFLTTRDGRLVAFGSVLAAVQRAERVAGVAIPMPEALRLLETNP